VDPKKIHVQKTVTS